MTTDPRAALDRLVEALEAHLAASSARRGPSDAAVARAYDTLADAFETYDEALYAAYEETTPFELYDEDDDDDDLDGDDETEDDDEVVDIDEDDLTATDDFDDHVDDELEDRLSPS
jgi:hypothetical protein